MEKIKHCINHNRFIPIDQEELTALELIGKGIEKTNELVDKTNSHEERISENEKKKVSFDDMQIKYKLTYENGTDYRGKWFGLDEPTLSDEGMRSQVQKNRDNINVLSQKYREETFFNDKYGNYLKLKKNKSTQPTNIIVDSNNDNNSKDFPCIEILNNGDILTVYRDGGGHATYDGVLKISKSTDDGLTFSTPTVILSKSGADYRDPNIIKTSNGTLILNYVERIENDSKTHRVKMARSVDNGATWVDLGYMHMGGAKTYSCRGGMTILPSGKILCPIYVKEGDSGCYLISSDDDGLTWNFYSWITKENVIETSVCYHSKRNEIIAVIRGNEIFSDVYNLKQRLYTSVSKDNGLTWSELYLMPFYAHCPIAQEYGDDYIFSIRNTDFELMGEYISEIFISDGKIMKKTPYRVNGYIASHDHGYIDFRIKNDFMYIVYYSYTKKIVFNKIPTQYLTDEINYTSKHKNTVGVTTSLSDVMFTTGKHSYTCGVTGQTDVVSITLENKPTSIYFATLQFENMNKVMISEIDNYNSGTGVLTFGIKRTDGVNITTSTKTLNYFIIHN